MPFSRIARLLLTLAALSPAVIDARAAEAPAERVDTVVTGSTPPPVTTAPPGAIASVMPTLPLHERYTDAELIDGFMKTVFGAEATGRDPSAAERVKKFEGPVSVALYDLGRKPRRAELRAFLKRLDRSVRSLDIVFTQDGDKANLVVFVVDRADYSWVIRETMPHDADTRFLESNDCSAVTSGRDGYTLDRAFVFLVGDEGPERFRHCMVEEIAQALGPVNDDPSLPHSIFNDHSQLNDFTAFDWFILNMLYDRRVKPGMTAAEVRDVLPAAISDCRKRAKARPKTAMSGPQ